jgi:hypothetical protein
VQKPKLSQWLIAIIAFPVLFIMAVLFATGGLIGSLVDKILPKHKRKE